MITFNDIKKANESITTTDIKGKEYAEVNQRIKAFRMVYPMGFIHTEMASNENGVCVFRAAVGFYKENGEATVLGNGTAYEKESSSYINKTSYIENCETSAVGRALGMAGFGIDVSVASYEEVANAIHQQEAEPAAKKRSSVKNDSARNQLMAFIKAEGLDAKEISKEYSLSRGTTEERFQEVLGELKKKAGK